GDIAVAAKQAPPGSTVVVSAGSYPAIVLQPGDLQGPIALVADVTGTLSGGSAGAAVISAGTASVAILISGQHQLTIDGFTVRAGTDAGIFVEARSAVTVRNCPVTGGGFDGVQFDRSPDGLVFNNLVFDNSGAGISGFGATNLRIINNTIYRNHESGIFL